MSTRKYTYPRTLDLSPGLQDVLRKNGMQAHISFSQDGGYQLIVLGHDSPALNYKLNEQQIQNLTEWGSNYTNKKAYDTFTSIVKNDFYMPDNFVSARNAFGRVALGLNGYRIGRDDNGPGIRPPRTPWFSPFSRHGRGWGGDFVGWTPRGGGWQHLRRIGDHPYRPWGGGPVVAERPDGRIKPGEARSGGYGFYYKGQQKQTSIDVLDNLSIDPKFKPIEAAPRPQGQGIQYSHEIIADTDVYFNNQTWQNVLKSHGIVIDPDKKTLTVQSNLSKVDLYYDLKPEELQRLTNDKVSQVSVAERIAIINNVIKKDFDTPLTKDMLETKELVNLELKPEVRRDVEAPFIEQERLMEEREKLVQARTARRQEADRIARDTNAINGREIQAIMGNKGWFQPVTNGREMYVGEIRVDKTNNGTYIMSAELNGRLVEHSITAKDYRKFLDLDDRHRLKMFDDIFKEVEIKSAHGRSLYDDEVYISKQDKTIVKQEELDIANATSNRIDGAKLNEYNEKKGFYRERAHGREVEVRNIQVDPMENGKYKMTAVINGQTVSHEITQKQYNKFLAVDDYHRMGEGTNIGAAILAALVVSGETVADVMSMTGPGHEAPPQIYESKTGPFYTKPGVVSSADIALANFRSQEANLGPDPGQSIGRGR